MPNLPDFFTGIGTALNGGTMQEASLYLLRNVPNFPPIIQAIHIIGIAVIMGTVVMLNLRILGLAARSQVQSEMIQRLLPWFWFALISNLISGSVFVFARPARYFNNPVFAWKLAFLIPAVLLTFGFHQLARRRDNYWELTKGSRWVAKVFAISSLGLWIMTAMAGRWIAYVEYIYYPA